MPRRDSNSDSKMNPYCNDEEKAAIKAANAIAAAGAADPTAYAAAVETMKAMSCSAPTFTFGSSSSSSSSSDAATAVEFYNINCLRRMPTLQITLGDDIAALPLACSTVRTVLAQLDSACRVIWAECSPYYTMNKKQRCSSSSSSATALVSDDERSAVYNVMHIVCESPINDHAKALGVAHAHYQFVLVPEVKLHFVIHTKPPAVAAAAAALVDYCSLAQLHVEISVTQSSSRTMSPPALELDTLVAAYKHLAANLPVKFFYVTQWGPRSPPCQDLVVAFGNAVQPDALVILPFDFAGYFAPLDFCAVVQSVPAGTSVVAVCVQYSTTGGAKMEFHIRGAPAAL